MAAVSGDGYLRLRAPALLQHNGHAGPESKRSKNNNNRTKRRVWGAAVSTREPQRSFALAAEAFVSINCVVDSMPLCINSPLLLKNDPGENQ